MTRLVLNLDSSRVAYTFDECHLIPDVLHQ